MNIELTWHLLLMIIVSIVLIINIVTSSDTGLDLSFAFYGVILVILWLIYGGIVWW